MAGEEKTEKATPKKRKDQRKEGNVLQSKEIGIAASVLGIFAAMRLLLGFISENIFSYTGSVFEELGSTYVTTDNIMTIWIDVITVVGITVGPVCLIAIFLGIIPTIAQTRGLFTMKALKPKFSRLNPLSGIKKLFSLQSIVGILKGLIEVIIISVVIYNEIRDRLPKFVMLIDTGVAAGVTYALVTIFDLVMLICIMLVFVAAADFLFQWWQFEKKLKMSKQEVKDEYKQQQMATQRMMQDVPKADVVVRNPTHFAVALKYDQDKNNAPQVLAKGKDLIALRIVQIAEENDVMTIENPPLARSLYSMVDVGREIPAELYNAVAEVLTVVYREKHKTLHA